MTSFGSQATFANFFLPVGNGWAGSGRKKGKGLVSKRLLFNEPPGLAELLFFSLSTFSGQFEQTDLPGPAQAIAGQAAQLSRFSAID